MPIDFPASPTTNQIYSYNNKSWTWSGSAWLSTAVVTAMPSGVVMPFAGSSAPTGYLLCDGSAISRTTYASLFTAIGAAYGVGDGSTTFNVPDLRGRMPMGAGTGTGLNSSGGPGNGPSGTAQTARTRGQWLGNETVTLGTSNIPQMTTSFQGANSTHSHSQTKPIYIYDPGLGSGAVAAGNYIRGNDSAGIQPVTASSTDHTHTVGTASPTGTATVPPVVILNYIIKT